MSSSDLNPSDIESRGVPPSGRWKKSLVLIILVVISGALGSRWILSKKPVPKKREAREHVVWVDVKKLELGTHRIPIRGMGEVHPYRKLMLTPEVSGRIIEVGEGIEAGTKVSAGQLLCRIESLDYQVAFEMQKSKVAQAGLAVLEERGRVVQAERERKRLGDEGGDELQVKLSSRREHLKSLEASLNGAKSQLALTQKQLERCVIKAPYGGVLTEWKGHLGSQVGPQVSIGSLLDDQRFDLELQLRRDQLNLLPEGEGNKVILELPDGIREGRWIHRWPEHHGKGRLVSLRVSVEQPLAIDPPLFVNAFVTARLESHAFNDSLHLPRRAIDDQGGVWLCSSTNTLERRPVKFIPIDDDQVLVISGLQTGDRWVKSVLNVAVEGMEVKPLPANHD